MEIKEEGLNIWAYGEDHDPYWVSLDRIDTPEKALSWTAHLSEKTWMKRRHLRRMIYVLCDHFGWEFRTP